MNTDNPCFSVSSALKKIAIAPLAPHVIIACGAVVFSLAILKEDAHHECRPVPVSRFGA
jgi:hypothetical protein